MSSKMEERVLPQHQREAARLRNAIVAFHRKGQFCLANACQNELDKLEAYKRDSDQLEILKENLISRGLTEIALKIKELEIDE